MRHPVRTPEPAKVPVAAAESPRQPEAKHLVEWRVNLNLNFTNETRLGTANPVEMMLRGSLDLGVHALVTVAVDGTHLVDNKKPI
ncbi:hypothetical protein MRX96_013366 [Rhipicephalus microplus]